MYDKNSLEFGVRMGINDALYQKEDSLCSGPGKAPYYQVKFCCPRSIAPGYIQVRASLPSSDGCQTLTVAQGDMLGGQEKTLYETTLVRAGLLNVKHLAAVTARVTCILWEIYQAPDPERPVVPW